MCGIAGIINFNSTEDMRPLLERMISYLHHRGPDTSAVHIDGPAGLAHARLSIIDLTSGDQPIYNEDKSIWVVFNGEIFNYPELRESLKTKGHRFYTKSDTEVLVHLYEEHGTGLFEYLNGQFAIALWDSRKKTLLLGRDRMGIRPLFYHHDNQRIVFGSEIKALAADPSVPRKLEPRTLSDIFTCWTPVDNLTPFMNIFQLPAAHYAEFGPGGLKISKYWDLPFGRESEEEKTLDEWTHDFKNLLTDAARIRLRADVPVGAYLSGGIDSTFISTLVKRNFNNLLRTFSVSFTDRRYDEASFQQMAVDALKTEHRNVRCSEDDIGKMFPKVVWHTETPILRTAPAPLLMLSGLVRENDFKVVLTGEGADELFAGYNIFKEDRIRRFWARNPESRMRPALLKRLYPYIFSPENEKTRAFQIAFFKKKLTETDLPAYSHLLRWSNTDQLKNFFSIDYRQHLNDLNTFSQRFSNLLPPSFTDWNPLDRAQHIESKLFLSNYLLSSQGDRMAMASSVEGRYPFLDHRVVEFAATLPAGYRLNGLKEKFILKNAARDVMPRQLVDRPKQPYRAPISRCFFGENAPSYVAEQLSEGRIREAGYFDPGKIDRLVAKCRNRKGQLLSERENMALVGILSTQLLDQMFIKDFTTRSFNT